MIHPNTFYVDWATGTEVKEGRAFLHPPFSPQAGVPKTPLFTGLNQSCPQYYETVSKKARMTIFRN